MVRRRDISACIDLIDLIDLIDRYDGLNKLLVVAMRPEAF